MNRTITKTQLEETVQSILLDTVPELKTAQDKITLETNLTEDLALDSLAWAEFFMAIEDQFQIQISEEETQTIATLSALIDCIERKNQT